jgi:predicted TIM-barrel fold metal-dependent hydrolase
MNGRRKFLSGAAGALGGLTFCSCGLLRAAERAPQTAGRMKPAIISGKRIRTVDVHAHCLFQAAVDLMGPDAQSVLPQTKGVAEHFIVIDQRLHAMDEQGIDMQVLSINPFWYRKERDVAAAICRINNEGLAELCARKPDRFAAFASLALQFPDLAVQQLEEAVKKYGLRGAAVGASVVGEEFSDPKFFPVWAKAQELGATLFIHPRGVPELSKRLAGNGWLSNVVGFPLDTTICLQHLIFEGTLDRFPGLKLIAAHGGGFLGSYAPRSDHGCFVSPRNCNAQIALGKRPTEYLNQIYFDSLVFTGEALRHLVAQVGASQVMIGTDHPIPWVEDPVGHVMNTPDLSDLDRVAILGKNAARVLGLDA